MPRPVSLVSGERYDCGAESLYAVMDYYGQPGDFHEIADALSIPSLKGAFPQKLVQVAKTRGYKVHTVEGSFSSLCHAIDSGIPAIVMIRSSSRTNHFLLASSYNAEKELMVFEFYDGWKWIFTREELEEAWWPCGFLQLEFERNPTALTLDRARALEAEGELEEALALYQDILVQDPKHLYARLGAGNCFALSGASTRARESYLIALEQGLIDPELFNNLSELSLQDAAVDDRVLEWAQAAVAGFEKRLRDENSELKKSVWTRKLALALGTLGSVLQARGELDAARQSFQSSLDLLLDEAELRNRRLEQIAAIELVLESRSPY